MFKKIRQWLFQTGHIQYIVNGEIWNNNNTNPIQLSHFRAGEISSCTVIRGVSINYDPITMTRIIQKIPLSFILLYWPNSYYFLKFPPTLANFSCFPQLK